MSIVQLVYYTTGLVPLKLSLSLTIIINTVFLYIFVSKKTHLVLYSIGMSIPFLSSSNHRKQNKTSPVKFFILFIFKVTQLIKIVKKGPFLICKNYKILKFYQHINN